MKSVIWASLSCPFIVNMHYAFQDKYNLYYVMDYYNGGELFHYLQLHKKFKENETKYIILQIIIGINYLHKHNIIYRSCKPEDILVDINGYIAITDFGNSKILEKDNNNQYKTSSNIGIKEYKAPEIILGEKYDIKSDYWSIGILLYELLHGIPPFYNKNDNIIYIFFLLIFFFLN